MIGENGVVEDFGTSQAGKPKVKISGLWYAAGYCEISDLQKGDHIQYDWKPFGKDGKGRGLQKWNKTPQNGNGNAMASEPGRHGVAPQGVGSIPAEVNRVQIPALVYPPELLPSVSNVVAHAITQGLIKSPQDLGPWVIAWRLAFESHPKLKSFRELGIPAAPESEEPPPYKEEEIPF